jgi:glycosyltransferase involved in cell wall biosynthesis
MALQRCEMTVSSSMNNPATDIVRTENPGIIVLGMHRSGTSAVTRVLAAAGAYPGDESDLLPVHATDNPVGYWERADLTGEHDQFLKSVGHRWDRMAGLDALNTDAGAGATLQANIRGIIQALDQHGSPWLVKDPRLCVLLPLWLPLLDRAAFVIVVRDPREIALSLRSTPRGTLTSQLPLALWEKYLVSALKALEGREVLFVSYNSLVNEPHAQTQRLIEGVHALGVTDLSLSDRSDEPLVDAHLHRNRGSDHVVLNPRQSALYEWLDLQTRAPGPALVGGFPAAPPPDETLAEFEAAFDFYTELGRQEAGAETQHRLNRIIEILDEHAAERKSQDAAHQREREQLTTEIQNQRLQIDEARRTAIEDEHRFDDEKRRHEKLIDDEQHRYADAEKRFKSADTENELLHRQLVELDRHANALSETVNALRNSWSWKLSAPLRLPGRLRIPAISWSFEQRLYRLYYGIPGISHAHKRDFIVWLHKHARWLTRRTMSYQLSERSTAYVRQADSAVGQKRLPRMDKGRAEAILGAMHTRPLISIAMPVYNIDARWLKLAVDSVKRQFYPNWELCIADDASTKIETQQFLDELAGEINPRIKIKRLKQNAGIASASNAALDMATGAYIGLLDHDDELTLDALLEVARVIADDDPDMVYSDEDKTDESNDRRDPFFKPDYSPEYFFSNNYICHFTVMRADILKRIGGFRAGVDGAQDFDLFLRFTSEGPRVVHIPKVLYHWRMITGSTAATASAKPYTWEAGRKALEHRLALGNAQATAEFGPYPNTYRVRYAIRETPLVSILIPFRDRAELLFTCVRSVLEKTDYPHFEIIGIDNESVEANTQIMKRELAAMDSRVRFIDYAAPFNYSAINNFGARHARGEHLLLLNNDTEVLASEWLSAMLEHSQRPEVGVVGAKLLYPDDTVQHAGVIIDRTVVAMHPHQFLPREHPGYAARPHLLQNLSAVTFACAMTRRDVFEKLQGLNETELPVCFNDVDYCLRAREMGYLVVFTPYAVLRHFESKSRGFDESAEKQTRFKKEFDYMQRRHSEILSKGDPYYNPGLSLGVQGGFHADPQYADELPT